MKYFLICFFFFTSLCKSNCTDSIQYPDSLKVKNQILAYPVIFYLPETRWGFGAAGVYNFRFRNEIAESNPSQIQLVASYTQNNQLIFVMPFELYRLNNTYKLKGELTYFRYQFNMYGIGIASKFEDKETYKANAPKIRMDILKRYHKTFLGIRLGFENFEMGQIKADGTLQTMAPTGIDGGRNSGVGFLVHHDKRNYIFNPSKGHYVELESFLSQPFTGSEFKYFKILLNTSKYLSLGEKHTLVGNLNSSMTFGDPPFFDMPFFGTPRIMRGYQDRRYLDKNMLIVQSEYRFPIYKRLQGVSFFSVGTIGDKYISLFSNPYRMAYGGGLRFTINKRDRVRLRLDYGLTPSEGGAFYLTINDAF